MAQSRLERIGTIYSRVTGLLQAGAMKSSDKPIWYNIYAKFPPKLEPRFDRPVNPLPIRNIFYEEDICRAKFHKSATQLEAVNLVWREHDTQTQELIKIYQKLKAQGALDDEKVFDTALELFSEEQEHKKKGIRTVEEVVIESSEHQVKLKTTAMKSDIGVSNTSIPRESSTTDKNNNFDVRNLFKE